LSSAADGQKVIAGLNDTLLGDRTLSVTEAHRGAEASRRPWTLATLNLYSQNRRVSWQA